eukprot:COSAG02_NODE_37273_length_444_cov_0.721739_1_plen_23_part_01
MYAQQPRGHDVAVVQGNVGLSTV